MFSLTESHKFYLYSQPTDMRKSFNGLCGVISSRSDHISTSGDVYIFINKSKNKLKLLHWESGGFVLYYKQLEQGTFPIDQYILSDNIEISFTDLALMIEGIIIKSSIRKKRYSL